MKYNWYSLSVDQALQHLKATTHGLSSNEAEQRLKQYGPNALPEAKVDSLLTIFFRQFQSPLIYVLILASIIVLLLGELTDSLIILFVLFFNSIIGTIQEGKAQNTLRALKQLAKTSTTVLRDGEQQIIDDGLLVPGDIILLQEGQKVPADSRIIEESNIAIEESALTGESVPVHKISQSLNDQDTLVTIADQRNMVFKGTYVTSGRAKALVVATGKETELGKIAQSVEKINTDIPLKQSIEHLTHQIIKIIGLISLTLFFLGLFRGYGVREIFATVVSLSVSAIPEGLPIVLTLVLSTGVWRMSKRNALIKKLDAVEALGQTTVIAVDKTGTITQNSLMVTSVYVEGRVYTVSGNGYEPRGEILEDGKSVNRSKLPKSLAYAAEIALANASAQVVQDEKTKEWRVSGDPTEAALWVFGRKLGLEQENLNLLGKPLEDFPFDYERKYRASLYKKDKTHFLSVAGAPENVLAFCKISGEEKNQIEDALLQFSRQGQRVVAIAYKENVAKVDIAKLPPLTFGGLFGMKDVLHKEIRETVERVHQSGMSVVMITGDHQQTAEAIAHEAGIFRIGDKVLTGQEIELLSCEELSRQLDNITVFARVTPEHKQKIVEAYRKRGDIIAMTGDGVNDAPSLVAADLGMAMGVSGTEVAKEAADIVLLDDNFKSIVAAIEEGRGIYITIKKVMAYLFATSAGEILVIASSLFFGLPLPVTAAQIIWLNLVTDGFLDVSLAMEPKDEQLLKEKWNRGSKTLVDSLMMQRILIFAVAMATGTLFLLSNFDPSDKIRFSSLALTVMAIFQWYNAWNSRSHIRSVFGKGMFANRYLIAATILIILLQIAALHVPFMQHILHTEPLSLVDWFACLAVASAALWVEEIRKFFIRNRHHDVQTQIKSIN